MLLRKLKVNQLNGTIMEDIEWDTIFMTCDSRLGKPTERVFIDVTGSVSERHNARQLLPSVRLENMLQNLNRNS